MSGEITLTGRLICADAGEAAIVEDYLGDHVRLTHAEPGCLSFEVVRSADPLVWEVRERFANRAAFEAHQARTAASPWGEATRGIAREYEVSESP